MIPSGHVDQVGPAIIEGVAVAMVANTICGRPGDKPVHTEAALRASGRAEGPGVI